MADLSSCYFCGAAMDASLRESPVVPDALAPTAAQQTTVVLCGTCERKLARVLEPVVAAATTAGDATDDATRTDRTDVANPTRAESGQTDVAPNGDRTDADRSTDDQSVVPPSIIDDVGAETAATGTDGSDETNGSDDDDDGQPTPFEVDDAASVFDDAPTNADTNSVFADTGPSIQDADDDADGVTLGDATDRSSTASTDSSQGRNDTQSTQDDTTTTVREVASGEHAADANSGTGNAGTGNAGDGTGVPDVNPRTYNKVVRLLKNRDLPVPRDEIEAIAGSAYDMPDHECEAILDAAIHRGLVAERNGQLTHPDGV